MVKVKVLKDGFTDIDSSNIYEFSIHSDYPSQKVSGSGQTTLTIASGNTSGTKVLNHSLGYAPTVFAMFETFSGRYVKVNGSTKAERPDDDEAQIYYIKVTSTSVTFGANPTPATAAAAADIDINVYYLIIYEPI